MPKEKLTESELYDVLSFANALYTGVGGYGIYNPFNQNSNLLGLEGKSTKFTQKDLIEALEKSPYDYSKLTEYSNFYATMDSIYIQTLRYICGLLSFDLTYSCRNIKNPNEYNSQAYKDDVRRVWKFLDSFDIKQEFRKILYIMAKRDIAYTWFRDSHEIDSPIELEDSKIKKDEKFALQILPQDICKLTGYFNNSQLLFDIDMNYFLDSGVDINLYAPQLKKMFKDSYKDSKYKPSVQLDKRNGSFANWVQCNPNYGAYAFKFDTSTFAQRPPFIAMLLSCMNNKAVEDLQFDKNMISAHEILAGEIPLITDSKTNKADNMAFSAKTMGAFLSLCTQGLKKSSVTPSALPLQNIKAWIYNDSNPSMAKNQLQLSSNQGVSASELIYHDSNLSQFAMQSAQETDYNFVKQVYSQFAQFLNFFINKKTVKYKFNFVLDGMDRTWYKKEKSEALRTLSDKGLTLPPQYWAGVLGIDVQHFIRGLEEAHNMNLAEDYLTLMLNANTMKDGSQSSTDNQGGRPTLDTTERSDKTEEVGDYVD